MVKKMVAKSFKNHLHLIGFKQEDSRPTVAIRNWFLNRFPRILETRDILLTYNEIFYY